MFNWNIKEAPFFTGIARGVGGAGFGKRAGGAAGGSIPFSGTGGVVSAGVAPGNGYRYHYFKTPGSFVVSSSYNNAPGSTIDILLVAGGGGGGARSGGGAGAGGVAWGRVIPIPISVSGTSIPITVGSGGLPGPAPGGPSGPGGQGGDSYFGSSPDSYYFIAKGGGAGASDTTPQSGIPGGSGGGSHYGPPAPDPGWNGGSATQPSQNPGKPWVTNYGNPGSLGWGPGEWQSGAGGGAGSAAGDGGPVSRGSAGNGQEFPTFAVPLYMPSPDPYRPGINPLPGAYYAGGGGGGDYPPYISQNMPTLATYGGGGIGGPSGGEGPGTPGINGLGGGGGGGTGSTNGPTGGAGGNGIVVIRYSI
jgi:hypothetical protein